MPLRYTSELAEHRSVRESAGLFDLSHMAEIEVVGEQAAAMLDHALVGDLSGLAVGRARYTMLCASDGGVLDDLVVYRLDPAKFLVVANASNTAIVLAELAARAQGFAVEIVDRSADFALIAVQGPTSAKIIASLIDAPLTRVVSSTLINADGEFSLSGLKYYASTRVVFSGVEREILLARTGYTGEDGFE